MLSNGPPEDTTPTIKSIELRNASGDSAVILNFGAILAELNINTQNQGAINTVLGYVHRNNYLQDATFLGAIAGRYCNRIANSGFTLNATRYTLTSNEGPHHLHGGPMGFSRRFWDIQEQNINSVTLTLLSQHGDQGYPGNLLVSVRYELADSGCLYINWEATSDRDTVVSLTNHSYFNLAGVGDIRNHHLRICADQFTPTTADMIPTGAIESVANTVLDVRTFTQLGKLLNASDSEITERGGLDHNWARGHSGDMRLSAELLCPASGLLLQASSTLPGIQCYTGNHLEANGIHGSHEGVCLEAQYYPNSPNEPSFPSPLLLAGKKMHHAIRYQITEVDSAACLRAAAERANINSYAI